MKIRDATQSIRQEHAGQFKVREDGKGPFTYVNDQKLKNIKGKAELSVFVGQQQVLTLDKKINSGGLKLFDFDAGLKVQPQKPAKSEKEEKSQSQKDKNTRFPIRSEDESIIDELA